MKVKSGGYESLERSRFEPDLPVTVEKEMIQRQTTERVVFYKLHTMHNGFQPREDFYYWPAYT